MINQIYIDLDGVLADFDKKAKEILGDDYKNLSANEFWDGVGKVDNLFLNLEPLDNYKTLLNYLESTHIPLAILTAVPYSTGKLSTCREDKVAWVRKYVSETIPVYTVVGGAKKAKYATQNSLLIDDMERNTNAFTNAGGNAILHTSIPKTLTILQLL